MSQISVIGIDPSLRNLGIARAVVDLNTLEFEVLDIELTETEKSKSKTVRKNSDDLERARLLHAALAEAQKEGPQIAFVEMPVGSQSASAMLSYGVCIALIASLNIPVVQLTPTQVKVSATGDKLASKREMIDWAHAKFPDINWLRQGKRLIDKNEHLADAIGAINAGLNDEDFLALVNMMRRMSLSAV